MKQWLAWTLLSAALLTGCSKSENAKKQGQARESTVKSKQASSSKVSKSSKEAKLDAAKLSSTEAGSMIVTYAAERFGGEWASLLQTAKATGLTITFRKTSDYAFQQPGTGYAYEAAGEGQAGSTYYTLTGDNFYFYQAVKPGEGGRYLGHASKQEMADELSRKRETAAVKSLAQKTRVIDKSQERQKLSCGRGTLVDVPKAMQGTWYAYSETDGDLIGYTYTFGQHTMAVASTSNDYPGSFTYLYTRAKDFKMPLAPSDSQLKEAEHWGLASFGTVNGLNSMFLLGWYQSAGSGEAIAVHTELIDGQPQQVLVFGGGAGAWVYQVAYRDQATAKRMMKREYSDLRYR